MLTGDTFYFGSQLQWNITKAVSSIIPILKRDAAIWIDRTSKNSALRGT
jgi:hypothetical protein